MTPTDAQIEAATEALSKMWLCSNTPSQPSFRYMAHAALTAAAEVGIEEDRDSADILRKLKPGDYSISVTSNSDMLLLGLARLKIEESTDIITFNETTVVIGPIKP